MWFVSSIQPTSAYMLHSKMLFLLKLSRSFGVFPIVEKQGNYAVSVIWLIYSLIQLTLVFFGRAVHVENALSSSTSPFQKILETGHVITTLSIVISAFLNAIATPKYINRFCETIDESLNILAYNGYRKETRGGRNVFGWWMFLQVVANVGIKFLNETRRGTILRQCLDTFAVHCFLSGSVVIFTTFVLQLDDALEKLLISLSEFSGNKRISKDGEILCTFIDVHYKLTVASTALNQAHYKSYFFIISGGVWSIISQTFKVAQLMTSGQVVDSTVQVLWLLFWSLTILATVLPCASAVAKSKKFNQDLSTIVMERVALLKAYHKEKLLLHINFDYTVSFDCGFFELDRTLIHSILGGTAAFAVTLLQIYQQGVSKRKTYKDIPT